MKINEMNGKIEHLREVNQSYFKQIKRLLEEGKERSNLQINSYFSYALTIKHNQTDGNFIFGSYHILNNGNVPLTSPYICIQLPQDDTVEFSGKYTHANKLKGLKMKEGWERIDGISETKDEVWLKPLNKEILQPYESLVFRDFQIKWSVVEDYGYSIQAFTYGKELKQGVSSLNQININGMIAKGDEERGV